MFGTLHWKSDTKEAEFIERPRPSSDPERNAACDRCRAKKVKCNPNYDGCSRCKGLQKPCTFTSVTPRSEQKRRKTNSDVSQQEVILELAAQASAPPGSRGVENMRDVYMDRHSLDHRFSNNTQLYGTVRDQSALENTLAEKQSETSPRSDLSFLDETDDQTRDQVRDSIFKLNLSSWPFCSANAPSIRLDPIQSSACSMPENLVSSPISLGDEMRESVTPNEFSQDIGFFDLSPSTTTASLQTPPPISTVFPSQPVFENSCYCLAGVIFSVEKLEASCNSGTRSELDSIIAHQKEAVKQCRSMLECSDCMIKRERLVMLVFMAEKIVAACGRIVALYCMEDGTESRVSPIASSLLSRVPSEHHLVQGTSGEDRGLASPKSGISALTNTTQSCSVSVMSSETRPPPLWQQLLLGDYEISSPLEWEHLVRVLIFLQLRAIRDLAVNITNVGGKFLGGTQMASLAQAGARVTELEKRVCII